MTVATSADAKPFAYVPDLDNDQVHAFDATSGALSAVGIPAATGLKPRGSAVSPDGTSLYVANGNSDNVRSTASRPMSR